MADTRTCAHCPTELGKRNKSGVCRSCHMRQRRADPAMEERRRAAYKKALADDPELRARHCAASAERLEKWRRTDQGKAFFRANSIKACAASNTPEAKARRSAAIRKSQTGWCPDDRRADYLKMRRIYGAREARRMMEEDLAAKERARVAAMTPHELQLERVRNGAKLIEVRPLRRADPTMTLGGVAPEAI